MSRVRVGTVERDRVVDFINEAAVGGYLDEEEREERVGQALRAKYSGQLEVAVKELPAKIERTAPEPAETVEEETSAAQVIAMIFIAGLISALIAVLVSTVGGHFMRHSPSYMEQQQEIMMNAQPLPYIPADQMTCTTFPAGFAAVFDPTSPDAGVPVQILNIQSGQQCQWTDPYNQGPPLPITLIGENGLGYSFPGGDEVITAPLGSYWDAKKGIIVAK